MTPKQLLSFNVSQTYHELVDDGCEILFDACDTPRIDAEVLLQHVIDKPLAWLVAFGESRALPDHTKQFYELVRLRLEGQPIAYLVGHKEFWSLDLKVTSDVLVPRPDTETLVEQALERVAGNQATQLLDLGTGSGAIALSLAKERPLAHVTAVDACAAALAIAKENAALNGLENLTFVQSNWFSELSNCTFDLIASNPPYVAAGDPHLHQNGLAFEPELALIAGGDGLDDLRTIIANAPNYLTEHGCLIVEHGYDQAEQVAELFVRVGFAEVSLFRDLNDLPRCTAGVWNQQ